MIGERLTGGCLPQYRECNRGEGMVQKAPGGTWVREQGGFSLVMHVVPT